MQPTEERPHQVQIHRQVSKIAAMNSTLCTNYYTTGKPTHTHSRPPFAGNEAGLVLRFHDHWQESPAFGPGVAYKAPRFRVSTLCELRSYVGSAPPPLWLVGEVKEVLKT